MEEYKTYKLQDVIQDIAAGPFGSNLPVSCFTSSGFPIIDGANLKGFSVTDNITKFVSEGKARSLHRSIAKRGDVIVTISGTIGQIAYIPEDSRYTEYLVSQRQFRVSFDQTKIYIPFLVYYFHTAEGQHKILSFANQTGVPALSQPLKNFKNIEVKIPSVEAQRKMMEPILSLDSKIEINRRINGNLEQQAQALYAKAFSSTNTCKMGDVVETTSGGTPSRKNQNYFSSQGIKWIKSKELNGSFIFDSEEHISNDGLCNSSAKLLPPNSTLIAMYGATVGAYGLTIDNATCNQAICALLPNSQYPYTYLYMWAKNNKDELIQKAIGSAQQNISQIIIKNMPVANEKDKIIRFDSDTRYIFSLMKSLAKENYNLIALRDALLPRLMSGELKINDLNR